MSGTQTTAYLGLAWPEAYLELKPLIEDAWGVGEDIYLIRKLGGGKSGALVYVADVTSRDFTGQAILKFDQAPDPAWQEPSEAERHHEASEAAPDFAAQHLPKILHSLSHGGHLAILSSIAGRGLEYATPWVELSHGRALKAVQQVSRELLDGWNSGYALAPGMQMPTDLLKGWLGYRVDPAQSRLHGFLTEACGLAAEQASFVFEGHWYPNPLAFASGVVTIPERLRLRAITGNVHGDLHGQNLLVGEAGAGDDSYHLIDLALYQSNQYLFYDHAYFELAYLLGWRGQAAAARWESILDHLSPFAHQDENTDPYSDDLGLLALVRALRREALDWVERNQANRLSYMENQILLARLAVGLNFANKRLTDQARRRAFLYAASNLKDYLKLNSLDWPKHGPAFDVDQAPQSQGAATPAAATEAPTSPGMPEKPSIAVLAFENLSGDPDQEYFADGVSEEIIMELSKIDWLMVISRGSTFTYKGQSVDAKRIGRELGVHYVVEGSVRKAGARVRVSVQVVDARSGLHVFAERYDRHLDDIFELQEDIAASIAGNIDSQLRLAERERASRAREQVSVWDWFQQGMWHFHKFSGGDSEIAKHKMQALIEQVPSFAGGHALLAILSCRDILFMDAEKPEEELREAYKQASKAVALDESSAFARMAMCRVYTMQGRLEAAIEEGETAVVLNPSSSGARMALGTAQMWAGYLAEALESFELSIRLSPKGPLLKVKMVGKGVALYLMGRYDEAEAAVRRSVHGRSMGVFGFIMLAAILVRQGRRDEAHEAIAQALRLKPELTVTRFAAAWCGMAAAQSTGLLDDLRKAGVPE